MIEEAGQPAPSERLDTNAQPQKRAIGCCKIVVSVFFIAIAGHLSAKMLARAAVDRGPRRHDADSRGSGFTNHRQPA